VVVVDSVREFDVPGPIWFLEVHPVRYLVDVDLLIRELYNTQKDVVVAFPILIIEREETHNKDKEEEDKNDENAPG
jgi:hypothetical protein